jgi:Flp pilus assembly pilin Flp
MNATKNRRTQIRRRRRVGQGMTEYIVLVGLIAILMIGAVNAFKGALGNAFNSAKDAVHDQIQKPIDDANNKKGT